MIFRLHAFRFHFRALDEVVLPAGKAGNAFRGAFGLLLRAEVCAPHCPDAASCPQRGQCTYARVFEPVLAGAPSGLKNPPRPFCLRAGHLDGMRLKAGAPFHLDLHVFDIRRPVLSDLVRTFARMAQSGLATGRGRAVLEHTSVLEETGDERHTGDGDTPIALSLLPSEDDEKVRQVRVHFLTPTELKGDGDIRQFCAVFARVRDRVSTLHSLYGEGSPLNVDYRALGGRAAAVRLIDCDWRWQQVERRSSRTGDVHGIGGFTGTATYEGELAVFLPWLRAAAWTGIGRHTVWGNGVISIEAVPSGA